VGDYFYLALPKGPINDDHILIIPIEHMAVNDLSTDGEKELEKYKNALRKMYDKENKDVVFF